jgi:HTH-type transcriptional regulator / antitoxin HigA
MKNSVKPIRAESDYAAALREVERLWGAETGSPAGDRLNVLATLIESYEDKHHPMDTPDPIEAVKFRMEQQGRRRSSRGRVLTGGT